MSAQAPSFLDYWRTLPTELQLRILSLVVTLQPVRQGLLSYHHLNEARYWNHFPFRDFVKPLLQCPEVKELVLEAFYSSNKFLLDFTRSRPRFVQSLDPEQFSSQRALEHVRKLRFALGDIDIHAVKLLEESAVSLRKYTSLKSLEISMCMPRSGSGTTPWQYLDEMEIIRFPAKSLRLTYEASEAQVAKHKMEQHEMDFLGKLELAYEMGRPKTIWTRLVCQTLGCKKHGEGCDIHTSLIENDVEKVESWREAELVKHDTRWTIKDIVTKGCRFEPYTRFEPKVGLG